MGTPIDLDKLRSLHVGRRTRSAVREWKSDDGERHKAVRDELGNTTTQHARGDRQDVHVRVQDVPSIHIGDVKKE
jgi:hypothetical protein